jgi:hypothetical protein
MSCLDRASPKAATQAARSGANAADLPADRNRMVDISFLTSRRKKIRTPSIGIAASMGPGIGTG